MNCAVLPFPRARKRGGSLGGFLWLMQGERPARLDINIHHLSKLKHDVGATPSRCMIRKGAQILVADELALLALAGRIDMPTIERGAAEMLGLYDLLVALPTMSRDAIDALVSHWRRTREPD